VFGGCYLTTACYNTMNLFDDNDPCPNNCDSGNGVCRSGRCVCSAGFFANDCSQILVCLDDCSDNGVCISDATCGCYPGWTGTVCNTAVNCPSNCTAAANGLCQSTGSCTCNPGFTSDDCSDTAPIVACPSNCSNNGVCNTTNGVCQCAPYASGPSCNTTTLPAATISNLQSNQPSQAPAQLATQNNTSTSTTSSPTSVATTPVPTTYEPLNLTLNTNYVNNLAAPTTAASTPEGQITPIMFGNVFPSEQLYQISMDVPPSSESLSDCLNQCSLNGICSNKTCYCEKGYVGSDCSVFNMNANSSGETYASVAKYAGICIAVGFVLGFAIIWYAVKKSEELEYMNLMEKGHEADAE